MAELQARKCTLAMTSTIVQRCTSLLVTAREKAEDVAAAEILSESCIVTTLLPLVLCHISPLVTTDPRVSINFFHVLNFVLLLLIHTF